MDAARNAKVQKALAALLALLVALVMAIAPAPAWAEDDDSTMSGSYTVYTYGSSGWAAGTTYTDFASAVEACNASDAGYCYILVGSDLTLTSDVSFTNSSCYGLVVTGDVTIDLGGYTLSFATTYYSIQVSGTSASLTLTNGIIKDTAKASGYETISVMGGATLETSDLTVETTAPSSGANYIIYSYTYSGGTQSITLGENTVLKSAGDYDGVSGYVYGVAIMGTGSDTTAITGNSLTLDGATITTSYFAIAGNGSVHGTTITISDSTITSTAGTAIYLPQNGTTTIYDSTITGALCGIEIRAGILDIYGDTTVSSTASSFSCTTNGSGTTTVGAAIAVSQHSSDIAISVTIHDGTYSGYYAVYENDIQNDSSSNISVSIEDGTFTTTSSATGAAAVSAADSGTLTISGGTYSVTPDTSYIDSNYYSVETVTESDEDGNATTTYVVTSKYEASYTTTDSDGNTTLGYGTLSTAFSSVADGGTVTLLKDVTLSSQIKISKAVTFDLNGYTLTCGSSTSYARMLYVGTAGNLTIKDSSYAGTGTITNKYTDSDTNTGSYGLVDVYGTLTIESGTYIDVSAANGSLLRGRDGSTIIISGGTFTCTATSSTLPSGDNGENMIISATASTVTITGGTFETSAIVRSALRLVESDSDASQGCTVSISNATITTAMTCGVEISGPTTTATLTDVTIAVDKFTTYGTSQAYLSSAVSVANQATVTIESGTYTAPYAVYVWSTGGTVAIEGGTFTAKSSDGSSSTAVLKADADTYQNETGATEGSAIIVTGGIFNGSLSISTATSETNSSVVGEASLTISGGWFTNQVLDDYCAEGYAPYTTATGTGDAEGMYTVGTAVASVSTTTTSTDDDGNETTTTTVTYYTSVQDALDAASSGATVTLLANVTESITVSKTVTLDLNGYTLTNTSGSHTITVASGGNLTVVDSSATTDDDGNEVAGTGVVDNVSTKCAALYVQEGGTATLSGGTFRRSAETGTSENTYYTILNQGTLTIANGTTVELLKSDGTAATYSSVIDNGWYSGSPETEGDVATLYITGGTINGGKYVKNDSYGEMYISGGTITGGSANGAILNWNTLVISGGTIENSTYAIFNCATSGTSYETGSVTITGGTFTYSTSSTLLTSGSTSDDVTISGGTFSTEVDEDYCATGYEPSDVDETTGMYTVVKYTADDDVTVTYDGKAHSVSVSGTDSGTTVTYTYTYNGTAVSSAPDFTNAGTYVVSYTVTNADGATATGSITVTINPVEVTVPTAATDLVYTGTEQTGVAGTTDTIASNSSTAVYTVSGGTGTNAGSYTATVTLSDTTNYVWVTGTTTDEEGNTTNTTSSEEQTISWSIAQVTTSISMSDETCSYDGEAKELTATLSAGSLSDAPTSSDVTITYYSDSQCTTEVTSPTTVGTYYAKASYAGSTNYAASSATATLTIQAADLAFSAVGYSGTYDGAAHGITVTADGATITYASSSDGEYSSENPTYTDAGTYTVYYKIVKTNYNTVTGSTTVVIAKATPTVTMDDVSVTYGTSYTVSATVTGEGTELSDATVTYTYYTDSACTTEWTATGSETQPTEAGTYYVKATYAGSDNYNEASATATITISAAAQTLSFESSTVSAHVSDTTAAANALTCSVDGATITYTSSDESVATVASNGTVTIVGAGTAAITATAAATANYAEGSASYTLTVSDHSYGGDGTWAWSDDYSSAALTLTCTVDGCSATTTVEGTVTSETTDATCTEDGSTVYTATATYGDTEYTDTKTGTIAATGHTEGETVVENSVEATCTEDGSYDTVVYCAVCGTELSRETVTVAATGHSYDYSAIEWAWADDYSSATATVTCASCDDEIEIEAEVSSTVVTAATCTSQGVTAYTATITVGEDTYTTTENVTVEATGHTWGDWVTVTDAACESDGFKYRTCSVCGLSETEGIDATGHSWEDDYTVDVEATCTTDGSKSIHCSACDATKDSTTIPAIGHSYEETETVEATCAEDGYIVYTCTACGDTYTETIAATGHSYEAVVTDPTCTEGGYTTYTCTVCGDTYTADETDATGHSYEAAEDATWSSDYSSATLVFTCSRCGETVTVDADGITYEVTTEATETTDGVGTYTATFTYGGVIYTRTTTVVIAATGTDSDDSGSTDDGTTDDGTTDDGTTDDGTDDGTEDGTTDSDSTDSTTTDTTTTESSSTDSSSSESTLVATGDTTAFTVGSIAAMGVLALVAGLALRRRKNAA